MKIIQLIYSLSQGGAERFVVNISNEMARKGNEVFVLQLLDDKVANYSFYVQFLSSEVHYINLGFTKGFSFSKVIKVCKTIEKIKPDVVHCHLNVIPYIFPIAIRRNKRKYIHTLHSIAEKASGAGYQKRINRWFYRTERIIPVTISEECRKSFYRYYNIDKDITFIDNGAEKASTTMLFKDVKQEISSFNLSKVPVFIHVARFSPPKNQVMLIESFNEMHKRGIDFSLLVIGTGFDSPRGMELQKSACEKIHFLGPKSNVGDYLFNSDFFVLSSLFEGLPLSLLEAMSAGCTPICTPVGGILDVIEQNKTGYLSADVTMNSFVKTLMKAISHPLNKNIIKESFDQRFSVKKCVEKYMFRYLN